MNNSAGVFQVDDLLAAKLRGSGLEEYIEVIARIDAEHEKRLLTIYRIWSPSKNRRCVRGTRSVDAERRAMVEPIVR